MIKVVIFDADDVLLNQERFSIALDRDYGISLDKTSSFFTGPFQKCLVGDLDLKETISPYLLSWGWDKGVDAFMKFWLEREYNLNKDLIAYVSDLRQKGILCFLATNQEKYRFQHMLEKLGFSHSFDKTYASAHLGYKKPNTDFFLKIFNDLDGVKKSEILFWDDDVENIKGAKDFGINAEVFVSLEDFREKMSQYLA